MEDGMPERTLPLGPLCAVNTQSELARIYNDVSVMENHHCAMTFAILRRKECALLVGAEGRGERGGLACGGPGT